MYNKISVSLILIAVLSLAAFLPAAEYKIIKQGMENESLAERMEAAMKEPGFNADGDYCIAYSFFMMAPEDTHFNMCISDHSVMFSDVLSGKAMPVDDSKPMKTHIKNAINHSEKKKSSKMVQKELVMFFRVNEDGELKKMSFFDTDSTICIKNLPIVWLGRTSEEESFKYLKGLYQSEEKVSKREPLIAALANHGNEARVLGFLKSVVESRDDNDLRADAVFWIGVKKIESEHAYLMNVAEEDRSDDVRERAVFALYLSENDKSLDSLIKLARNAEHRHVRKQAVFWIGQIASKKALESLDDMVYSEGDTDLQKQVVFAISQQSSGGSFEKLVKIAKTHKNPKVRKQAIFWIGQSDDKRALDFLVDLAKK